MEMGSPTKLYSSERYNQRSHASNSLLLFLLNSVDFSVLIKLTLYSLCYDDMTNVMKMRKLLLSLLLWTGLQFASLPLSAMPDAEVIRQLESFDWISEEYPPYNFRGEDDVVTGMAVDILMAGLKKVGATVPAKNIKILPWKEGYKRVQRKAGTVLFSTTYTPERQQVMKFVGPSVPIRVSIIAPKSKKLAVKDPSDLSPLKIGVVRDDIGDQLVRKFALSDDNIAKKDTLKQLSYFFQRGRVDVIAYVPGVYSHYLKNSDLDPNEFEEVYLLKEGHVGYAFHNSTAPEVLAKLQAAIDELRSDGTIDEIIAKYTK
jgi:polar amino acid transport system substrate-binding protein